jgi:hypothetical protein
LLAEHLFAFERRVGKYVGKYIERQRHVGFEHACVIGGAFRSGSGIEIAAHSLDLFRDLPRAAPAGALESHMFKKVGNTVLVMPLVTAARGHPHAE